MNIHPSAIIDPKAQIGENVKIGPFVIIENDVVIGDGTEIKSSAVIKSGARIGKECRIFQSAVISEIPQDLKFSGEKTLLEIGDRTTVREFCTLNRGTSELGKSSIGNGCLLMAYVHVAHDCVIEDEVILGNNVLLAGHVCVESQAIVSGGAAVNHFVTIGSLAMVGGMARVIQDIPPYMIAEGAPARARGVNVVGLKRKNHTPETIGELRTAFRKLIADESPTTLAIQELESQSNLLPETKRLIGFLHDMERGFQGRYRESLRRHNTLESS